MFLRLALLASLLALTLAKPAAGPGSSMSSDSAQAMMSPNTGAGSGSGASKSTNKVAVLREFTVSGVRNVRWETTPMQMLDASGKVVTGAKVPGSKNPDGSTSFGCVDAQGKKQDDSTEYERPNGHFKYRCNNGAEEVVACVGSERTKKARIEVGKTLDVDGFWHKCQSFPNGSVVYTQETTCTSGGKDYRVGEEIQAGNLRLQCQESGYKVVGCSYVDENKKVVHMNAGDKKEEGKVTHFCEEQGDQLRYFNKGSGCTKNGKEYKEGETFSQNHIHYKCTNGFVDMTGCYIDEKRDLGLNQDIVDKNMVYRCYRQGGKVNYNEYACGFNGTPSCKPEAIPKEEEDPALKERGMQSRGFGGFAVAQKTGGNMLASPSTLKLELDKLMAAHAGQ